MENTIRLGTSEALQEINNLQSQHALKIPPHYINSSENPIKHGCSDLYEFLRATGIGFCEQNGVIWYDLDELIHPLQ